MQQHEIELKGCPFCGSDKIWQKGISEIYQIECRCGACGPTGFEDDEDAQKISIDLWNTRK